MATKKADQKATGKSAGKTTGKTASKVKMLAADPPITIKGGSIEIELDKDLFPPISTNPKEKKHSNATKKLDTLEITDLKSPANTLMQVNLDKLVQGKCLIVIRYK